MNLESIDNQSSTLTQKSERKAYLNDNKAQDNNIKTVHPLYAIKNKKKSIVLLCMFQSHLLYLNDRMSLVFVTLCTKNNRQQ